jgi:hypothetical protein
MPLSTKLNRKLQAAEESSDGEEYYEVTDRSSSESFLETGDGGEVISSGDENEEGAGAPDEAMVSFKRHCDSWFNLTNEDKSRMRQTMTKHKPRSAKSHSEP